MIIRSTMLTAIAVAALSASAGVAQADHWDRVDDTAVRLASYMKEIEFEVQAHYRNQPGYAHLLSDAREMAGLADHIHELAHHGANPYHLKADVDKLDRLFHHLEGLIEVMERRTHYYSHYHHRFAPIHDTRHVRLLLVRTESLLHLLQAEARVLAPPVYHDHHDHNFGRPGFSFGNGRIRFSFGP